MKLETKPFRFTRVDFMASFLPGTIWLVLLIAFDDLFSLDIPTNELTPISTFVSIANIFVPTNTYIGLLYFAAFVVASFLIGYCVNQFATSMSERICFLDYFFKSYRNLSEWKNHMFPYNSEVQSKPYFSKISSSIKLYLKEDWQNLPGKQPYSTCKRILKTKHPELWEEVEHMEADSRMTGSLFLASLFSTIEALLAFFHRGSVYVPIKWLVFSIIALVILGRAFRKRRKREVKYTYLNYLIVIGMEGEDSEAEEKGKMEGAKNKAID
jgi:hypothetical protein